MRHFAIVGSGPAGFYTAEALLKLYGAEARIDMIDRLPTPYGLVRSGVAPDHQSLKAVAGRFDKVADGDGLRFCGGVALGRDVSIGELGAAYDAVVLATGAPHDRPLGVPGDDLPGVIGSAAFVGWYNGHPDFADLHPSLDHADAAIVGNGNVALDIARILAKTRAEFGGSDIVDRALNALEASVVNRITLVGRRGPHQIAMTPKELAELGHLQNAVPWVDPADLPPDAEDAALDPGQRKSVTILRSFAAERASRNKTVSFDFFARPVAVEGAGRVERLIVERTRPVAGGPITGETVESTEELYAIPCGLLVTAIGYRTPPLPDIPYDEASGRFPNSDGRVDVGGAARLYAVGWARRGPSGTIGTNRPDGYATAEAIRDDLASAPAVDKPGGRALDALLAGRGIVPAGFADWRRIEAAEAARARPGSPREKFTRLHELHAARGT